MADGDQKTLGTASAGTKATADTTEATLAIYRPPDNTSCFLIGKFVCQELTTPENIRGGIVVAVCNTASGTTTVSGNTVCVNADPSTTGSTVDFDSDGQDVRLRIVGEAATTNIRWFGSIEIVQVEANDTPS